MQYTSKFSGEEIDSILDSVASKQDAIPDLETIRSNAQNASDTISRMVESGYLFAGIATIDTNPPIPNAKVFYIANGKGKYEKFGGLEVTEDDVVVLYWDTAWHKVATGIASQAKLSELESKNNDIELHNVNDYIKIDGENIIIHFNNYVRLYSDGYYSNPMSIDTILKDNEALLLSSDETQYVPSTSATTRNLYFYIKKWNEFDKTILKEDILVVNNLNGGRYYVNKDVLSTNILVENIQTANKCVFNTFIKTEKNIYPNNTADILTQYYNVNNSYFTALPIVENFKGSIYVEYFIYKPYPNNGKLELRGMYLDENKVLRNYTGIKETINLSDEWLDDEYGVGVYKIPYFKYIDFIPSVQGFYFSNKISNGIGYIASSQNIDGYKNKYEILFGLIGTFYSVYNDIPSKSKWENKKIGFLGDSITNYGQYINAYKNLTNCNAINYGVAGTHIAKRNTEDTQAFEVRYANMENDLDMVVIFGGTNDFGHSNTEDFGDFTDGTDASKITFYAGLHRLFSGLYKKYLGKPIVVVTPIHHGYEIDTPEYAVQENGNIVVGKNSQTNKSMKEYVEAIKEVAQYYSLLVLDAYSYSQMSPMMESSTNRHYFSDGLHLNDVGGEKFAKWLYPQLEQIYDMFYS